MKKNASKTTDVMVEDVGLLMPKNCIKCGCPPLWVALTVLPPLTVLECPRCGAKTEGFHNGDDAVKAWNLMNNVKLHTKKVQKKPCDEEMPVAKDIDDSGPFPRWAIYCSCGTTIFNTTKDECEKSWQRHVKGEI